MRRPLILFVMIALASALLDGGSSASVLSETVGNPPPVCTDPSQSMPTCLLHTWVGSVEFSPHIVAEGGILTATVTNVAGIGTSSMQMRVVPTSELVYGPKSYCSGAAIYPVKFKQSSTFTCAWKMVNSTNGWAWGSVSTCGDYGCATFEDYYAVAATTTPTVTTTPKSKPNPRDAVARVGDIKGHVYLRRGPGQTLIALHTGDTLFVGDVIVTDQNSAAAIEMLLGGYAGIGKGQSALVVEEGQVTQVSGKPLVSRPSVLWGAWSKFKKDTVPLTIQTRGGGSIKG